MKPIHGLILAIGLGLAGALFNFAYLTVKARNVKNVYFVGIKQGVIVGPDKALTDDDLEEVGIPANLVGNLRDYAYPVNARESAVGKRVWRTIQGGRLLLDNDFRTPPLKLDLEPGPGEPGVIALGVPVGSRTFPLSLIKPGDRVSFFVSRSQMAPLNPDFGESNADPAFPTQPPTPAAPPGPIDADSPQPFGASQVIGPFTILAVGPRLGSIEVMRASKIPLREGNSLLVRVVVNNDGTFRDPKAQTLLDMITSTSFRQLGVMVHGPQPKATGPASPTP